MEAIIISPPDPEASVDLEGFPVGVVAASAEVGQAVDGKCILSEKNIII